MINTEKNIFINETEIKPNRYASLVMLACFIGNVVCLVMNELGLFRVGDTEMRIGSSVSLVATSLPLLMTSLNKSLLSKPITKFLIMACAIVLTACITTLLTFHTTIMLLFPMFVAMLYRSATIGKIAMIGSVLLTIFSPIAAYLLGTWDVPLFQELILIATGGEAIIANPTYTISGLAILKILLYIVIPRLIMVGSCSLLMFYIIKLSGDHVQNQILLNRYSHIDVLTNCYNQNYFKEIISNKEVKGTIGVIFFDVNDLKKVNDNMGHEYGDLLLSNCAKSLLSVVDENKDYVFRVGGDEFVMISQDADETYIKAKMDNWHKTIDYINLQNRLNNVNINCSMAFGYTIGDADNIETLVKNADENMYQNKTEIK